MTACFAAAAMYEQLPTRSWREWSLSRKPRARCARRMRPRLKVKLAKRFGDGAMPLQEFTLALFATCIGFRVVAHVP